MCNVGTLCVQTQELVCLRSHVSSCRGLSHENWFDNPLHVTPCTHAEDEISSHEIEGLATICCMLPLAWLASSCKEDLIRDEVLQVLQGPCAASGKRNYMACHRCPGLSNASSQSMLFCRLCCCRVISERMIVGEKTDEAGDYGTE